MRWHAAVLLTAILFIPIIPLTSNAESLPIIPLDEGTEWIYAAKVRWTVENSNHVREGSIRWKMRVLKSFKTSAVTAAVIRGFVDDLAWYEPQKKPGYSVLVETAAGLFETNETPSATEAAASELAKKALEGESVGEQMLRFPIRIGDCLDNDDPQRVRKDNMYCWFVEGSVNDPHGLAWVLSYSSLPDDMSFHLVPGVGVTQYHYNHHGTVASAEARLISFRAPVHH